MPRPPATKSAARPAPAATTAPARSPAIWLIGLLSAVLVGLCVYYFAVDLPARKRLMAELEERQKALAAKQDEIEARQKAAVQRTVDQARQAVEEASRERMAQLKQKALAGETLAAAAEAAQLLKTRIAEYHAERDRLPQSLADLGLSDNWTPNPRIHAVQLEPNRVRIALDNAHIKGNLVYEAQLHQDAYLNWQCSSPDIQDIDDFLPACRYAGGERGG